MAVDYTLQFNGLTVGAGTTIGIMNATGLEDLPPVRAGDQYVSQRDGQVPGLDLADGRTITLDLLVLDSGAGDFFATIEALKAATVVAPSEFTVTYQLPGRAARVCRARARRRSIPVSRDYQFRYGVSSIELHATDPRFYDVAYSSVVLSLPSASSGLTFNATAPFVFGSAGTGGVASIANAGNYPAPWLAQIAGPVTNPSITINGVTLSLIGSLAAGDVLTVDSDGRSVLLNGTASRYSWLAASSTWASLPPGTSSVQFGAAAGTGQLTFFYRSCWL